MPFRDDVEVSSPPVVASFGEVQPVIRLIVRNEIVVLEITLDEVPEGTAMLSFEINGRKQAMVTYVPEGVIALRAPETTPLEVIVYAISGDGEKISASIPQILAAPALSN